MIQELGQGPPQLFLPFCAWDFRPQLGVEGCEATGTPATNHGRILVHTNLEERATVV